MNILFFSTDYKPKPGGLAEYTYQVAKHFKKSGHNVIILSIKMPNDKEFDKGQGFETFRVSDCPFLRELMLMFRLFLLVKRYGIEFVFSTITHLFYTQK
ncbi:glycogen/starch synthase [Patescibacteria group bacterium]|nr:glycogen/starch synthase [Patescibacteria group bacterium]